MKIDSQRGMILFLVLMILQMISLFCWVALQAILLEKKSMQAELQMQDVRHISETILTQVENQFTQSEPSCFISATQSKSLMAKSLAWWQSTQTCAGNFHAFQYYYVIELLGNDACAYLAKTQTTADYYRITLLTISNQTSMYLQSTIVKASNMLQACASQSHAVMLGRQSWRELNKG